MKKPLILKMLLAVAAALFLIFVPKAAPARGGGGSHGGKGSHGGNSHGGGGFHSGGRSSFRSSGKSYSGSRGGKTMSSPHWGGGRVDMGRTMGRSYSGSGRFSSSMSGNFASGNFGRSSSTFGRGNFGSSANSRGSGVRYWAGSQPAARNSRSNTGAWQGFGNSAFRSTPGWARTSGMAMGGGWSSFGMNGGGRSEASRGYGHDARTDSQWHSFGNRGNGSFGRNVAQYSFSATSRANPSDMRGSYGRFNSNRFSNASAMSRFSSFSSYSDGRSIGNFRGSRHFETGDFAGARFGGSGFGDEGFSSSLGSDLSLFPNLLFGGLLHLGTAVLGGGGLLEGGLLAGNVISLAAHWLGSGLGSGPGSTGFGQDGSAGVEFGYSPGGFGIGFGLTPAPAWPACGAVASFPGPGWGWQGYCGPPLYRPLN